MKRIRFSLAAREMLAAAAAEAGRKLSTGATRLPDGRFEAEVDDDVYDGLAEIVPFDASDAIIAAVQLWDKP